MKRWLTIQKKPVAFWAMRRQHRILQFSVCKEICSNFSLVNLKSYLESRLKNKNQQQNPIYRDQIIWTEWKHTHVHYFTGADAVGKGGQSPSFLSSVLTQRWKSEPMTGEFGRRNWVYVTQPFPLYFPTCKEHKLSLGLPCSKLYSTDMRLFIQHLGD